MRALLLTTDAVLLAPHADCRVRRRSAVQPARRVDQGCCRPLKGRSRCDAAARGDAALETAARLFDHDWKIGTPPRCLDPWITTLVRRRRHAAVGARVMTRRHEHSAEVAWRFVADVGQPPDATAISRKPHTSATRAAAVAMRARLNRGLTARRQ